MNSFYSILDEKEGGIVIDPYCGSGTTLVAAKILKHHYIGIDITKEYVEYAQKRVKDYKKEVIMAPEEISKHVVTKTFKERKENDEFVGKYRQSKKTDNLQKTLSLFDFKG